MTKQVTIFFCLLIILVVFSSGCSSRYETPVIEKDSTIVYQPKNEDGITAKITFCEKINKKAGRLINEGTIFTLKDDAKVNALVSLENREIYYDRELLFHLDWIEPNGNSFYRKKIELMPDDTSTAIISSISIPPGKREPGNYVFRVYLFRELIAEKNFVLKAYDSSAVVINADERADSIKASVTLYRKINKKSGALIDPGTVFTIKKKALVNALIEIKNQSKSINGSLKFYADWTGPDNKSIYRKKIELTGEDSVFTIKSSISITPEKRQPGNYVFRIYLLNKLLAEKKFILKAADKDVTVSKSKEITDGIKVKITLCGKVSKKTGKLIDAGTVFTIKDKAKVYAVIELENRSVFQNKKLKFYINWIGPNDSSFYGKKVELTPEDSSSTITSSISITPGKREPGNYIFRFYLSRKIIAEQKFELISVRNDSTKINP